MTQLAEAAFRKMYPRKPDRAQIAGRTVLSGAGLRARSARGFGFPAPFCDHRRVERDR